MFRFFTICFCCILALVSTAVLAEKAERQQHNTFELNAGGTVSLENSNGHIRIQAWDENRVDVKATKRGNSRNLDLVEIEINSTPERLAIKTVYPKFSKDVDVSVDYDLMVPKSAVLDMVQNVNGPVDISGVQGSIDTGTVNGPVEIDGAKSSVKANSVNGRVTVTSLQLSGKNHIQIKTVNGAVKLYLPESAGADVTASSLNGSIHTDFPITVRGTLMSRKLSGKIGSGDGAIDISTVNGSIDILKASSER